MITDDKAIQEFFQSLKNVDRDMLVIEDFKDRIRQIQGTFSENE